MKNESKRRGRPRRRVSSFSPVSKALFLLTLGHLLVFAALTTQMGFPHILAQKLVTMPVERDLQWLWKVGNPERVEVRLAFDRLNRIHPLPENFFRLSQQERQRVLKAWKEWWEKNKIHLTTPSLNGLVFLAAFLAILGLAGLIYRRKDLRNLLFLLFCLEALCFFTLFVQYEGTQLAYFYAFAFMVSTFTLGYLAQPNTANASP